MQCYMGTKFGSLDSFSLSERETPMPAEDEVRVRVMATALGFVDGLIVQGKYQLAPPLPYIPGGEIAGVIDAVGSKVSALSVGDRVATWQLGGGLADYAVAKADQVDPIPPELDFPVAAAMLLDYQTTHYALFERGNVRAGETVLVLGASGGVGSAAVQLAARIGARVIAAASTQERRALALRQGAFAAIDSGQELRSQIRALAPAGIDIVVDPVGGPTFEPSFRSLAKNGRHLVIGFASGQIPALPANLALLKSGSLIGVDIRYFRAARPQEARRALSALFHSAASGELLAPNMVRFGLHEADRAMEMASSRDKPGKVVVMP